MLCPSHGVAWAVAAPTARGPLKSRRPACKLSRSLAPAKRVFGKKAQCVLEATPPQSAVVRRIREDDGLKVVIMS